jgi:DNA-binding CsgD family transcriptional regulator
VNMSEDDYLAHYGILRRSGRYPWGSGDDPQNSQNFLNYVEELRSKGLSETEIARGLSTPDHPITTTQLRAAKSIARNEQRQADIAMAQRLRDKGYSNVAIGKRMGINESSVRSLLAPGQKDKVDVLNATTDMLKQEVAEKKYIDVGTGVEHYINGGISDTKLRTAVAKLREEGYEIKYVKVEQLGTGKQTTLKVLTAPNTPYSEVYANRHQIKQIIKFSEDGGRSYLGLHPPLSIDSKRIGIRYAEEGGADADGVIYVRPGVNDVSLGNNRYAQVRIAVDGTHYLKGMAMYKDDMPPGVDLVFNTNKKNTGNKLDAMKKVSDDPDNPFGSTVRQLVKRNPDGKEEVTSAMNIVNEDDDWARWSKSLSSQFLSKQSHGLARQQLDMTYEQKKNQLDTIMSLTNPSVRKKLLAEFADSADASAVHLKAAALPKQKTHVILPINSLKENEVYAPNYQNGERVVLVRFPHGGTFEIPEVTVNNRNQEGRKLLGQAQNAIGINNKVAQRLSGADFDGDTVLVIPNRGRQVKTSPPLEKLKTFDPQASFPPYDGMKTMGGGVWDAKNKRDVYPEGKGPSGRTKGIEMGRVSNLITDMTIRGANDDELARAVRHSMVVIDAEKHHLNFRQSAIDNGIPQLMRKYQHSAQGGASTVVSQRKRTDRIPERKERSAREGGSVDKETGRRVYTQTGATYIDKATGKVVIKTTEVNRLAEVEDANTLSSGTLIEKVYADHSNRLKALANDARKASVNTRSIPYSPSAKTAYANEVASLNSKLVIALRNAPLERQAQIIANATYAQKLRDNPDREASEKKKLRAQALAEARVRTGAGKQRIKISDSEWAAIQAGAISPSMLDKILLNADLDVVKELATPRTKVLMTPTKRNRATQMLKSGYTQAEVAQQLGVSLSTLTAGLGE